MGILIKNTDFVGAYRISQNCFSDLDVYIEENERKYIEDLLGSELSQEFISDLNAMQPQTQKFIDIYDPFTEDDGISINRSEGMKKMLIGMIYFDYVRDVNFKVTTGGVKRNAVEVSNDVGTNEHDLWRRYNRSIETYNAIQGFICDNLPTYSNYNGQMKYVSHWSF